MTYGVMTDGVRTGGVRTGGVMTGMYACLHVYNVIFIPTLFGQT